MRFAPPDLAGNAPQGQPTGENWGKFEAHICGGFNARSQDFANSLCSLFDQLGMFLQVGLGGCGKLSGVDGPSLHTLPLPDPLHDLGRA